MLLVVRRELVVADYGASERERQICAPLAFARKRSDRARAIRTNNARRCHALPSCVSDHRRSYHQVKSPYIYTDFGYFNRYACNEHTPRPKAAVSRIGVIVTSHRYALLLVKTTPTRS